MTVRIQNDLQPGKTFLLTASACSGLAALALLFLFSSPVSVLMPVVVFTCVFLASYAVLYYLSGYFIYSRIAGIWKDIRSSRPEPRAHEAMHTRDDSITMLHQEVLEWTKERKEEIEKLHKLEMYRKEFLGNVSHELKTPIFNIQGYVHTLLDGGIDDPKINRDYLGRAAASIDRLISIVDDLEALTRLESGELELEPETFDLAALVQEIFNAQELNAKARGISFLFSGPLSSGVKVHADRSRIRQVLTNLIMNSVRYGKEGGETKVGISDTGDKIRVEIADNGIGISKEHLPRIFERFYRADKSRSRELGGTGLGLAIVKHIIEAHKQTIDVMSTEGAGSVFAFSLSKPPLV